MNVLAVVAFIFAVIGAVDYVIGCKFGIGRAFEKGYMLLGTMALSMIGMIVISPWIAELVKPALDFMADTLRLDPSIVPASLFANDMGGAPLSVEVARNSEMGLFNALVVSSMMGCTISFTIPFALGLVRKEQERSFILGLLSGIVTIPVGCFVAGLVCGLPILALLWNLLPLVVIAGLIAFGLLKAPNVCVKIFRVFGFLVKALVVAGLLLGIAEVVLDRKIIRSLAPIEEGAMICLNASIFLAGALSLMHCVSALLGKPLKALGRKVGINEHAAVGLLSCLITNATVFSSMDQMDDKGTMVNSAFAVSAAFVFGGHMAFTIAFDAAYVLPMVVGKLVAGGLALAVAFLLYKKVNRPFAA